VVDVPADITPGAWSLEVVTNGTASTPALAVQVGTRDCYVVMDRSTVGQGEVLARMRAKMAAWQDLPR